MFSFIFFKKIFFELLFDGIQRFKSEGVTMYIGPISTISFIYFKRIDMKISDG
jgi:hypothetical protein